MSASRCAPERIWQVFCRVRHGCLLAVAFSCSGSSWGEVSAAPEDLWQTVSDHQLDDLRGGFDFGAGVVVSFGISRVVYVNDQLITATGFQIGDVSRLSPAQANVLAQQLASMTGQAVQRGPGNMVDPTALAVPFATYIQNTLNNQSIRVETVIQAATNGMSVLKDLNFQSVINDALIGAFGNR